MPSEWNDCVFGHGFRDITYSKALGDQIKILRDTYGFYDARKR